MITRTVVTTTIISVDGEAARTDWSRIVSNLNIKLSLAKIALKTGSTDKMLSNLKNNVTIEPRYRLGIQLLALHCLECSKQHKTMGFNKDK